MQVKTLFLQMANLSNMHVAIEKTCFQMHFPFSKCLPLRSDAYSWNTQIVI